MPRFGPKQIADTLVKFDDHQQQDAQDIARVIGKAFNSVPFLRGRAVEVNFTVGGAKLVVTHKLGVVAACFVIRWNHDTAMMGPTFAEWNDQSGLDQRNQLAVVASAACLVTLWFYPRSSPVIPTGAVHSP